TDSGESRNMAGGDSTERSAAKPTPVPMPVAPPPLVLARGAAAGLLAGIAAQTGDGEVLVVPGADAAVSRLARVAVPPPFVLVAAASLGPGLGRFLRVLADPDLAAPVVVVGPGTRAERVAAAARRLGLPVCVADSLEGLAALRTI